MTDNIRAHIGGPADMGRRFVDAWHRAELGETFEETNVTFRDLEALLAVLTPKRLHLLRYVRHHQVRNVSALATSLGRNYKNVHTDVSRLLELKLVEKAEDGRVAVTWQAVRAELRL